jgi:hypothetical protein
MITVFGRVPQEIWGEKRTGEEGWGSLADAPIFIFAAEERTAVSHLSHCSLGNPDRDIRI